jgi:protocatechuate 4,5-dioxygenase beta chain
MPIGLGLASPHAPSINVGIDHWKASYERLTKGVPQPAEALLETDEIIQDQFDRMHASFGVLRDRLEAYKPDLLVMVGGDQTEMFDRSNVPSIMIYTGAEAWGQNTVRGQAPSKDTELHFKVDVETSRLLLKRLVREEGFDIAISDVQDALGNPDRGLPHAFTRTAPFLMPKLDIPMVIVYVNTYDPPSLTAQRCYDLGQAIAKVLQDDPRRIAIYGSGGLSHDPGGPRSGWIDQPLDRWFLGEIERGNAQATNALYKFDSQTMRGGTGEIRAWISVAGAMERAGSRATIVDYIPAYRTVTGMGWAYWDAAGTPAI